MNSRSGRTVGFYLSPAAQGYLGWTVKWLKTSQGKAIEETLYRFVEQQMLHGAIYTTWNKVAQALQEVPGHFDGFEEREEDIEICLVSLTDNEEDPILGWLEVLVKNTHGQFCPCCFDAQGRNTNIHDWLPPHLHFLVPEKKEGITVPVTVLGYLLPEEG